MLVTKHVLHIVFVQSDVVSHFVQDFNLVGCRDGENF